MKNLLELNRLFCIRLLGFRFFGIDHPDLYSKTHFCGKRVQAFKNFSVQALDRDG